MKGRRLKTLMLALSCLIGPAITLAAFANAEDYYAQVQLPRDVTLELPRNWIPLDENQRTTVGAAIQSLLESVDQYDATSEYRFAANLYDTDGAASAGMHIRYYPDLKVSQPFISSAGESLLQQIDASLEQGVRQIGEASGAELIEWRGTRKLVVNGKVMLLSEYKRGPLNGDVGFVVRLARVVNGPKTFTVTVSYREDERVLLRPITDRIINSISQTD